MKRLSPFFVALIFALPTAVVADVDVERANLAKLSAELEYLVRRVDEIKRPPSGDQRMSFDYESLKRDLLMIRGGIDDYIDRSIRDGRVIKPLNGHYHKKLDR